MEKDIFLSVTAKDINQQEEPVRLRTFGSFSCVDGEYRIRYSELDHNERESSQITLTMKDTLVTMRRKGICSAELAFEKGYHFDGSYQTPLGEIAISILPTQVEYTVDQETAKGNINLQYHFEIGGHATALHELDIEFHPKQ